MSAAGDGAPDRENGLTDADLDALWADHGQANAADALLGAAERALDDGGAAGASVALTDALACLDDIRGGSDEPLRLGSRLAALLARVPAAALASVLSKRAA